MKYLLLLFLISFVIQQLYLWIFFSKFAFYRIKPVKTSNIPVSIVICGKNEAKNFATNIPKIINQKHTNYEIILVDDHSTDNTWQVLTELQNKYMNVVLVSKENVINRKGKKQALFSGVSKAKNNLIVVTDADCYPSSVTWLQQMIYPFENIGTNLVLGLAPNEIRKGFWQGLFRFETYFTALQYVSFALKGLPYMGVGRNMAYRKTFFLQHFPTILEGNLSSGDDDLLINLGAETDATKIVFHPNAHMLSPTPESLKGWFRQKTRHLSAGFEYKFVHKFLLSSLLAFNLLFILSGIVLLFTNFWLIVLPIILGYLVSNYLIHSKGLRKFYCDDLLSKSLVYQILWFIFAPIIAINSKLKKSIQWN